jgi:hypothetical protein
MTMWTYIRAWERAAKTLGVAIEGPVHLTVGGQLIEAPMLVRGFGAPIGTLVTPLSMPLRMFDDLRALGYTASSFGPYPDGKEAGIEGVMDTLNDWTWCGEGPAPAWVKPSSW